MDYKLLFYRGWGNLWKNPVIWIFAIFSTSPSIFDLLISISHSEGIISKFTRVAIDGIAVAYIIIGSAGLIYLFYAIERGDKPSFLETWNAIKPSLWRYFGVNAIIFIIAFAFTVSLFVCVFIGVLYIDKSQESFSLLIYSFMLVYGLICQILAVIPGCNVIIRKQSGRESLKQGVKLLLKNAGYLTTICLIFIGINHLVLIINGTVDYTIYSMWLNDASPSIFQLLGLLAANPLYRINNILIYLILVAYQWSVLTLSYLELTQKAGQPPAPVLSSEPDPVS